MFESCRAHQLLIGGGPCTPPGSRHSARSSPLAPFRSLSSQRLRSHHARAAVQKRATVYDRAVRVA